MAPFNSAAYCLHIVNHGKSKSYSLGLTPKGVKTYESFVVARQLMNRSIYYHKKVKVLEYMVESIFQEIIKNVQTLSEKKGIGALVPEYLIVLGKLLTASTSRKFNKASFMNDNLNSYLDLTEDSFWLLARQLARTEFSQQDLKRASFLSKSLLERKILNSFTIHSGKDKIVDETLTKETRLKRGVDYDIIELKTTMYKKESSDDRVFVVGWNGEVTDVSAYSELIAAFRDKPEVEKVLIVLDPKKFDKIKKALLHLKAI